MYLLLFSYGGKCGISGTTFLVVVLLPPILLYIFCFYLYVFLKSLVIFSMILENIYTMHSLNLQAVWHGTMCISKYRMHLSLCLSVFPYLHMSKTIIWLYIDYIYDNIYMSIGI